MKAAIASKNLRLTGTSHLSFEVDENAFFDGSDRAVSRVELLDGTVVVTDWGFAEGRKEVRLGVHVDVDDFESLRDIQEDNDNTFLFFYKTSGYVVIVRSVTKTAHMGLKVKADLRMDVVQKLNQDGVYP